MNSITFPYHEKFAPNEDWAGSLAEFLNETPDGARFLLNYFDKPLTEYTEDELLRLQQSWDLRAISDLPTYLRTRIG